MAALCEQVLELVEAMAPEARRWRHLIHRNPELALEEHQTAALVRHTLAQASVPCLDPLLGTDVIGILEGAGPGRSVVLRADMDALPLQEQNADCPYRSRHHGCMHACGHDGHTAILLGTALVLAQLKHAFRGTVRFVFQPGEEVVAAGKDLVAKGALGETRHDAIMALHAWAGLPAGAVASRPGPFLAQAEFFKITVFGKGAHGSRPEDAIDPVLTGARIVDALQAICSRRTAPLDPAVVSVCRFTAGANGNIIPDTAELEGTTRCLDAEVGVLIRTQLEQIVRGVCDSMGASCRVDYLPSYIPTVNDPAIVELGRDVTRRVLGESMWIDLDAPVLIGEDFAFYIQDHPGAMFFLGMGADSPPLHNAAFNFNDAALRNGILFLAGAALRALAGE